MANILARKFFSRRVTIPSNQAITYLNLMKLAPATTNTPVWGSNADGSPSMDSTWGDGATIIALSQVMYFGFSQDVSDTNSAATYIGVTINPNVPFNLNDYWTGPVDISQTWLFSRNAQDCDVVFQGRQ